ncbi:uncharacterized protein C8Q71DRAFT_543282 [Rhodofomes roseus]|uniref:Hypervirulence associated protein TUDOR domain-containing protein n=1 Tax=Rhodofomes roseus TaxID=34475 RepID=A0ABQ8KM65_9APHY|nr:uncharacterized protein C8Q71DRAFT_543282 [Rhodofomes roseus]KAH9838721.1 hypothetical protein C8Q71DRAFT_543282 [Rhodofomes roseus]
MPTEIEGKDGQPIEVGHTVSTRFRVGTREGEVEAIVENQEEAKQFSAELGTAVRNPPKGVFTDQHGCHVAHNPEALTHTQGST